MTDKQNEHDRFTDGGMWIVGEDVVMDSEAAHLGLPPKHHMPLPKDMQTPRKQRLRDLIKKMPGALP